MGQIKEPIPVVVLLAVTSRHPAAFQWARHQSETHWGAVELESRLFSFDQTQYYESTMGIGLKKQFLAFQDLIDPAGLSRLKIQTNDWESAYQSQVNCAESRPLNLDPGYICEGKLVLASTKDHAHRIYLSEGIYAEVTLRFQAGGWRSQAWTFPDYQEAQYHAFFDACRLYLRTRLGR
jgi:hypothetical protein